MVRVISQTLERSLNQLWNLTDPWSKQKRIRPPVLISKMPSKVEEFKKFRKKLCQPQKKSLKNPRNRHWMTGLQKEVMLQDSRQLKLLWLSPPWSSSVESLPCSSLTWDQLRTTLRNQWSKFSIECLTIKHCKKLYTGKERTHSHSESSLATGQLRLIPLLK